MIVCFGCRAVRRVIRWISGGVWCGDVRVWVGGLRRETPVRFRQTRDTGGWGVLHAERAARALLRRTAALR